VDYPTQEKEARREKLEDVKLAFGSHVFYIRSQETSIFEKLSKWIHKQAATLQAELKLIHKL
jgi:hypothetical protein